ncbi:MULTISPECIES: alpha/beta fold hydrolase [Streptomyces]|uniref:alpha/beta fold hydrolase n=1 Tax=Streptomyces TaxID=1883 RepID=UPI0015FF0977|nr:alpha/beta hydrolase [Streptomyces murinus]MBA9049289.1 pimeloyl-ACP methyl ester carboxylesterase [Streptomyces murinus]
MTNHETGFAPVNGTELYYERAGSGDAVVLLHTGNGNTTIWDGQFEDLARDYTVVRYDCRGFGRSGYPDEPYQSADDLAALLDHLGIERAHVIGPSFGGRIAVEFAVLHPARVRSLLLAAPVSREHEWTDEVNTNRMAEEDLIWAGDDDKALDISLGSWVAGPKRTLADMDPTLIARLRITATAGYDRRRRTVAETGNEPDELELVPNAAERLGSLQVPTLVLIGGMDQPDAIEIGERLARDIPGARAEYIDDLGHMITMERPEEFLQKARAFLAEAARAETAR